MSKVSKNKLPTATGELILDQLAEAFARLSQKEGVLQLLDSLITKTERIMFTKRLAIAVLLERGITYTRISKILKVSPVSVGFVKNNILKGNSVYAILIKKLDILSNRIVESGIR